MKGEKKKYLQWFLMQGMLFILPTVLFIPSYAQVNDSLKQTAKKKIVPFLSLDSYNSFITNTVANSFGVKAGIDFGGKVKFGAGYYTLSTDIVKEKYIPAEQDTFRAELKSHYFTLGAEYVVYEDGPWQVSVPAHIGIGSSFFEYYNKQKVLSETDKQTIILFEPAFAGHYKILRWVGIGFGAGYRLMLKNNTALEERFNSPLYSIYIKIFVADIYDTIFPKKKSN